MVLAPRSSRRIGSQHCRPGNASLRPGSLLQHLFRRSSAGAESEAWRPRRHQDHRCGRRRLGRQADRRGRQSGDRSFLCRRRRAGRHARCAIRQARDESRDGLLRQSARAVRRRPGVDFGARGARTEAADVDDRQGEGRRAARSGRRAAGRHRAAAQADARLRRRRAVEKGSDRRRRRREPSAATWTTPG